MAGIGLTSSSGATNSGVATKTLSQIVAAANHRVRVERVRVSGNGTTAADTPTLIELVVQTSAGTASAQTLYKRTDGDDETIQTSALKTFTAEPTDGGVIKAAAFVHPTGRHEFVFPPGRDLYIQGGQRLGVRCNAPSQTNGWNVSWDLEE